MRRLIIIFCTLILVTENTSAQQNWNAVPCFSISPSDHIGRLLHNKAQDELILCNSWSNKICNKTYKGLFAFDGSNFHDMDLGIEPQDINPYLGSIRISDVASLNGKAIITGAFFAVGKDTLYSKGIAEWNGTNWSQFSKPLWNNTPNWNTGGGISKMLEFNGGVYLFANYDTTGTFSTKPVIYNGSNFTQLPSLPVSNQSAITEAIMYKGKLIVGGGFYNYPSFDYRQLAQFDGTNWAPVGGGIKGNLSAVQTVAVYNDTLYIGGSFPKSAGNAGNYLMKWDGNQLLDAGFTDVFCGYSAIWSLVPFRGKLYAFGTFECAAGEKAFGVAYYENGQWTVPKDSIEGPSIMDAIEYNGDIYIGGGFKSINGDTNIKKFAKLTCPNFDSATGCISGISESNSHEAITAFPNPTTGKLLFNVSNGLIISSVKISSVLGQNIKSLNYVSRNQEIDISDFSTGIYFLSYEVNGRAYFLKIVKE